MAYACAMVNVALGQDEAIRPLWVDIQRAWGKPGCAALIDASLFESDAVNQWFHKTLVWQKGPIPPIPDEWKHPDMTDLLNLMDDFIVKAFNGPKQPIPSQVMGAIIYNQRKPRYRVRITHEKAPLLKLAVFLLSWIEVKGLDLEAIARSIVGDDHDLVISGEKPSTKTGREHKPMWNEFLRNDLKSSFIKESTVYKLAEKWYCARVIRGSVTQAASDYGMTRLAFEGEIEDYDHVAGLR
jgi:hypothetical protein